MEIVCMQKVCFLEEICFHETKNPLSSPGFLLPTSGLRPPLQLGRALAALRSIGFSQFKMSHRDSLFQKTAKKNHSATRYI